MGLIFISFLNTLFLMYRNSTEFCILICVPQFYCIYVFYFFVKDLRFSRINYVMQKQNHFYLFLSNLGVFYLFYLIALARTSSVIMNRSDESGVPYLVPNLRIIVSPLRVILTEGLSCCL